MRAYKFLRAGAVAPFSGHPWPVPADGPGEWVHAAGPVVQCGDGVHACRVRDLPYWLDQELWEVELGGEVSIARHQLVASRGRLVARVGAWSVDTAWELAADCTRRATELAVRTARDAGLAAETLASAVAPIDVEREGLAVYDAALAADEQLAARVAYAAVTAARHQLWGSGKDDAVAYAAFALYSAAASAEWLDPRAGHDAERARQAAWLAERLSLA